MCPRRARSGRSRRRAAGARLARAPAADSRNHLPCYRRAPGALLLDATGRSGIASSIVLTLAAPDCAPLGRHLVATTASAEADIGEEATRRHLAVLYDQPTGDGEHLQTVRAEPALVVAPPPLGQLRKPVRLSDTLFIAGDHRDTPSLQGALVSRRRAARAVLRDLGVTGLAQATSR